jgi:cardiolipin synthase
VALTPTLQLVWHLVATHLLSIVGFAMAVLLIANIVREQRTPGSTFAWLLAITLVPYVGVPLYLIFGGRKLKRQASRKALLYAPGPSALREGASDLERMLVGLGAPPARNGNRFQLLTTGETAFAAVIDTIDRAERTIEISTLILAGDEVGAAVLERLEARARAGVEVRLLIDAFFSLRSDRRRLAALRRAGGRVAWFMPVVHIPFRGHANLRLHRKAVIADQRTAIVGGMNLAREYMGPTPYPGRWRDLSMRISGPVVDDIAAIFCSDWAFAAGETLPIVASPPADRAGEWAQVVGSGPDVASDLIYDAILSGVFAAKERLWIATPYFIPDEALARALALAARRGVDVRVLLPARSNHRMADFAGASYLRQIAAAGAHVLRYLPGMLHAKLVLIDESVAVLGSANMDMRSLFLDYEIALFCSSPGEIDALANWFESLAPSTEGLPPAGRARTMIENVARLVGPLV